MTFGEAISKANWWLQEVDKSVYIMYRKDVDRTFDMGFFVLTEDDNIQEALRYADIIEYCNKRLKHIDIDLRATRGYR